MDRFVVMGVAGSGKSSVAAAFAVRIGARFIDGDDLHPPTNIEKMSMGTPLTDDDRAPWLAQVGRQLAPSQPCVIACSALKRAYRDIIRSHAQTEVMFVHLEGSKELIAARMDARNGHFMPTELLDSQFETLEPLEPDEVFVRVDIDQTMDAIVSALVAHLEEDRP